MEGPPDCPFKMYGYLEYICKMHSSFMSLTCSMPGKVTLELPDGTKYSMQNAECLIENLTAPAKTLNVVEEIELRDLTNNWLARVTFDANAAKRNKGMMSRMLGGKDKPDKNGVMPNRRDLLKIEIIELSEDGDSELIDTGNGSYLEQVTYDNDGEPCWTINDECHPTVWSKETIAKLLPSDSYQRADLNFIIEKKWDEAEAAKHELEELQRHDKKLRTAAEERRGQK